MFNNNGTTMFWDPSKDKKPLPMIYGVVRTNGEWSLTSSLNKFKLPNKIYGKIPTYVNRMWNSFINRDGSMGVLLLGLKGTGKTETGKLLANTAIQHGMGVVMISEVTPDIKLIKFISELKNVVIFIDEYGKLFRGPLQSKSLTMFSDVKDNKKLFILTENDKYIVDVFLLNRPGRLFYNIEFKRLSEDVVTEYCNDHHVDSEFLKELMPAYKKSKHFSFDHLQALVIEHLMYPTIEFEDLVEIMNVDISKTNMINKIISIKIKDNDDISFIPARRKYEYNEYGVNLTLMISKIINSEGDDVSTDEKYKSYIKSYMIQHNTIVYDITADTTTYLTDGVLVKIKVMEDDGQPDTIQPPIQTSHLSQAPRAFGL